MTRDPTACASLDELRIEIDHIDRELVALLARRARCIDRAVTLKRAAGLPARIDSRIAQVLANARSSAMGSGLDPDLVTAIWRQVIEWSVAREERVLAEPGQ
jgi:isochorismate pyruvate lyase